MPDVVTISTAPTIEIYGLNERIDEIRAAAREALRFIGDRMVAAQDALNDWRGPHSDLFAPEVNRQLEQLGELRDALESSAVRCAAASDGPGDTGRAAGGGLPPPAVPHPELGSSTSSAKPRMLKDYATVTEAQDPHVDALAAVATVADLRAVVHGERSLSLLEKVAAVAQGKSAAEIDDMRVGTADETTADRYIWLPDVPSIIEEFATRSGGFAEWVRQVAAAFAAADSGRLARLAAMGKVVGYDDGKPDLLTGDATGPGSDVLKLQLRKLPPGMSAEEWAWVFEAAGVGDDRRPIHFVIHGWGSDADGAAKSVAARYDARGVDAIVIAVDWDAGKGAGATGAGAPVDFNDAERQGAVTGDTFADALSGLARVSPDADVAITAHSLGNHVAMRGISQYSDPTGRFKIADYTAIEPAVPDDAADHAAYKGAFGERVEDLTLTINNEDGALFLYEQRANLDIVNPEELAGHDLDYVGPEALGDEAYDGDGIEKIRQLRGDGALTIVDHDSAVGGGHLGLDPNGSGIVSTTVGAQVDDLSGLPAVSRDAHELLRDHYGADLTNDFLLENPAIRRYIEDHAATSTPIDEAQLTDIADEARARRWDLHLRPRDRR